METVVVVGNCQAKGLELELARRPSFLRRFRFVSFPAVHEIPAADIPALHAGVASAEVVLLQTIADDYRGGLGLGNQQLSQIARSPHVLRWPSIFWSGYTPDLFYLRDAQGAPVVDGPFDYHDQVILGSFADGHDAAEAIAILSDPNRPSGALASAQAATVELAERSEGCEIQVSPFIEERYREELLFFTLNHPSASVLSCVADQVLELLGIGRDCVHRRAREVDPLSSTFYPLHANHVRELGLSFGRDVAADGKNQFRIRGVEVDPLDAVRSFYDYYSRHQALVEINLERTDSGQDFGGTNGIA